MHLRLTSNTEEFIQKSNLIHNNKYDYSKVEYINAHKKVKIICPIHGQFKQKPNNHLSGKGCYLCGVKQRIESTKTSQEKFIEESNKIHNYKYDYSKVNYVNSKTKVIITCPEHGDFQQSPECHLNRKQECYSCSLNKRKLNIDDFIIRSRKIHGYRYSYDDTILGTSKVKIKCQKHGYFYQNPHSHLLGFGCSKCNESIGEKLLSVIFEQNGIEFIPQFKIPGNDYKFRYDFYLPKLNVLIEFHGLQHYKPSGYLGGVEKFKDNQRRDIFKIELAKLVRIPLIIFNYKHLKLEVSDFEKLVLTTIDDMKKGIIC